MTPSRANCTNSSAEQSTLAPESRTTTGLRPVGKSVAIAGRFTPACSLSTIIDAAICAPVFPADTNASDLPSACSLSPTIIELLGFPRIAAPGLSFISMTSGASTIETRSRCPRCDAYCGSASNPSSCSETTLVRPTSCSV